MTESTAATATVPTSAAASVVDEAGANPVCVFAVCRPLPDGALDGVPGHPGGGPPRLLVAGALAAVVQEVPAAEFAAGRLTERLADPRELERCARAHHAVVTAVARATPVVPLPLATLYLGAARALAAVAERADDFARVLDRLGDRAEWGVKVSAVPGGPAGPDAAPRPAPPAARPADGRAYLDRVRGRQRDRQQRQEAAWSAAERSYARLRRCAVAARRLRPQDPVLAGGGPRQLLNAALLLDADRVAELRAVAAELAADPAISRHARIEVTGPWVPYSFARLDDEEEDAADAHR
ncbi:GvpL/GvpF family gas vesicle protein [Streptomyces sp. DSM 44915]|uniref:GvpL/GvpF family gas vesicle protein n=1 Tax=Streptomyces chisholmiae TaxID=3075540 RepID=A0ABU2JNF1_9ACTN|nr:GvpL/GvpF family gas vesicle protein [Streptomyces sp. DSM 44915]MDT0265763.1 GvpL/GvpF family gas vesicle protein [Streptomyces sp. DSM 44915]